MGGHPGRPRSYASCTWYSSLLACAKGAAPYLHGLQPWGSRRVSARPGPINFQTFITHPIKENITLQGCTVGQITLTDAEGRAWLQDRPARDLDILRLIAEDQPAARIARVKGLSKALISRIINQAVQHHLLTETSSRPYNKTYKVERPLKDHLARTSEETAGGVRPFVVHRPHNIRLKYRITMQGGPLSRDKRAGYLKSWKPRGPERLMYWIPGRADMGSVTIEAHPGSLVGYYSAHQEVVAENMAACEALILTSIHEAVLRFVTLQARYNCRLDLEAPTTKDPAALKAIQVTDTHYPFPASRNGPLGALVGQRVGPWWVDGSPADAGDPDHIEVETKDLMEATDLENGLKAIQAAGRAPTGPDLLRELEKRLSPIELLTTKVEAIHAMVSSGTTLQARYDQVVGILAGTMGHLERAMVRIDKLEKKVYDEKP
jgi:hypothetical protein